RTIPTDIASLADLGCPEAVKKLAERRTGLILVTGPTGSGKSTTLAGMIRHINETRACHILTIEDPVEFVHTPIRAQVTHREVGPHASSFATAIRSAGREDPDVVLVGELRGTETMKLALQLASFGRSAGCWRRASRGSWRSSCSRRRTARGAWWRRRSSSGRPALRP